MSAGISTINTVLKCGTTASNLSKLCNIKTYPELGGSPDMLETTDLEDTQQTFTPGVQSTSNMEFTCNYTLTAYKAVLQSAGTAQYYQLEMGDNGADGKFQWQGMHYVHVTDGSVNAVREMVITVIPSSAVTEVTAEG